MHSGSKDNDQAVIWLRGFGVTAAGPAGSDDAYSLGMKGLGLIIYLADEMGRAVTRDALVELLWERVTAAQGKGSLRQEIRRIKKAMGAEVFDQVFEVTDHHLLIRPHTVRYDAADLLAVVGADDADTIAACIDIYSDEFLVGNVARSEPFQDWARDRRSFLSDAFIAALVRLGHLDLDAGRIDRAQRVAEKILQFDPLHERGAEITIRCHLESGRRGQAQAYFEKFRKKMLLELTTEPEEALAELVRKGVRGEVSTTKPAVAAKPPLPKAAPAFAIDQRPTIAVLNVSRKDGGEQSYIADGVAEQLVSNLSKSTWIRVASLSLGPFTPTDPGVETAQRDLRGYADYVLRVDVRVFGDRVSITSTLNRIIDNETVFSSPMEDRIEDLMALQRKVAIRIASIFEPMIVNDQTKKEAGIVWDEAETLDHWRLLMRARSLFWTLRRESNAEARTLLSRAIEIKADDVPSHCILAFSHMLDAWSNWSEDIPESFAHAARWAGKAVRIDPNDAWAQFTLGVACTTPDQLDQARSRHEHALRLSPSLAIAIGDLGRVLVFAGEPAAGAAQAEQALELSPYDQQSGLWIRTCAMASWMMDDLDKARELVDYSLVVRPGWFQNHLLRAVILSEQGKTEAASRAFQSARQLVGEYSDAALSIGHPFQDQNMLKRFASALNKAGGAFTV